MKIISLILPIYNGEKYIEKLVKSIRNQKVDYQIEIVAPVSKSKDNSLEMAKQLCDIAYEVTAFNHALTRHEAAEKSTGEILVFITQDILPYNDQWLATLIEPLVNENEIVATYSKQVAYPDASTREKLIREFNYPDYDRLCNLGTKEKWGRKNIYFSDAASATIRKDFFELGGYNFNVGTNEDVVYAINVINSGKSILYNSKSKVYHSHEFRLKESLDRYKMIGEFEKMHQEQLNEYSSLGEGTKLLKTLIKELLKQGKIKDLFILIFDLSTRYIGYNMGYKKG